MSTSNRAVVQDGAWPAPEESGGGLDYLSPREFEVLAQFIEGYAGIKMPPSKKTMVECRLRRRAQALGMRSLKEYCEFLFHKNGLDEEFDRPDRCRHDEQDGFLPRTETLRFLAGRSDPCARRTGIPGPAAA